MKIMFAKVFDDWLNPFLRALAGFGPLQKCWQTGDCVSGDGAMARVINKPVPSYLTCCDYPVAYSFNR